MKSTKLMLMGGLLMLLGISLATSIAPAIFGISALGNTPALLKFFPGIEAFLVVIGFVMGVVGFTQKDPDSKVSE